VGGADATEIAVHAARKHTGRRRLVAIKQVGFHGSTDLGLSISGSSSGQVQRYLVDASQTTLVPYNDLAAMQAAITSDTAAVVMEVSPAQGGFPIPAAGYLAGVRAVCRAAGAMLIFDEVQTGLGLMGTVWAYQRFGVVPDMLTFGKLLGGGLYPISAALMSEACWSSYTAGELDPHESTYAGADIGCVVGSTVLDMTTKPAFLARVRSLSARFGKGFAGAPFKVTRLGLCMGIRTSDPLGTSSKLVKHGVFTVPSFDDTVVPFRPPMTLSDRDANAIIAAVRGALG